MQRDELLARAADRGERWDVVIIGGGATGLGAALDAATRGYRTLLLERGDFACGTSSRSTKLIHGGVRYLRQGNLALVRASLREREWLLRHASSLVKPRAFFVPAYRWWEEPFYDFGFKIYGMLAKTTLPRPRRLSREEALESLPGLNPCGLRGGELYHDAQFDDARLAVCLAQTVAEKGGVPLNYVQVVGLNKRNDRVSGVRAVDVETGLELEIPARVVINATGVFADEMRRLDEPAAAGLLAVSQGAHLVLPASFLPGETALMIPRTADGRVLFAIPWLGRVLVGTTETPVDAIAAEPRPLESEVDFLLEHAARYFVRPPARSDVVSAFAGLRPLVKSPAGQVTSKLARDHMIEVSRRGLVTIVGGKWTTFRKMGEDVIDRAMRLGSLEPQPCITTSLNIYEHGVEFAEPGGRLHFKLPYGIGAVKRAVRHEFARTLDDVLSRRTRALLLDARASLEIAPRVASLLAAEIGRDAEWERAQVQRYGAVARAALVTGGD